jgi:hypothetical protein
MKEVVSLIDKNLLVMWFEKNVVFLILGYNVL